MGFYNTFLAIYLCTYYLFIKGKVPQYTVTNKQVFSDASPFSSSTLLTSNSQTLRRTLHACLGSISSPPLPLLSLPISFLPPAPLHLNIFHQGPPSHFDGHVFIIVELMSQSRGTLSHITACTFPAAAPAAAMLLPCCLLPLANLSLSPLSSVIPHWGFLVRSYVLSPERSVIFSLS